MRILDPKNERGVALLIVLLVTALLIALVFEFAYATRISVNSAVNFRDSQRAYFLALTGINAFKSPNAQKLRDLMRPGFWERPPLMLDADTDILIKWEDESGKIKINDVKTDPITQAMVQKLLENKGIDADVYQRMTDQDLTNEINRLTLLSGLRQYMTDEEFIKLNVDENFTISPVAPHMININAASADVLQSMGISPDAAEMIIKTRKEKAYSSEDITSERINGISGLKIPQASGNYIKAYLTANAGSFFKVAVQATVGDYTKEAEAILSGNTVVYWKAL
jgi:type II secretory pathway component PulK